MHDLYYSVRITINRGFISYSFIHLLNEVLSSWRERSSRYDLFLPLFRLFLIHHIQVITNIYTPLGVPEIKSYQVCVCWGGGLMEMFGNLSLSASL